MLGLRRFDYPVGNLIFGSDQAVTEVQVTNPTTNGWYLRGVRVELVVLPQKLGDARNRVFVGDYVGGWPV